VFAGLLKGEFMVALYPTDDIPARTTFAEAAPVSRVDNERITVTFVMKGTSEGAVIVRPIFGFAQVAFDQGATVEFAFESVDINHVMSFLDFRQCDVKRSKVKSFGFRRFVMALSKVPLRENRAPDPRSRASRKELST